MPFFIDTTLGVMLFFWMGNLFMQSKWSRMKPNPYLILFSLALYFILISYLKPSVNTRDNLFPWYLCLTAPVSILALYYLSDWFSHYDIRLVQWIKVCGISSLFIFALHGPIYEFGFIICGRLELEEGAQVLVLFSLSIPICLYIERMVLRYISCVVGK